jgi:Tol biopolymer transport system component
LPPTGTERTGTAGSPAISGDGRVAFYSTAALVPDDTNGVADIFVRDCQTGVLERPSLASDGTEANNTSVGPAISRDGRFVAFVSYATNLVARDTNGYSDVFVHDRATHQTIRASISSRGEQGDLPSADGVLSMSDTGRWVAFDSSAHNLVKHQGPSFHPNTARGRSPATRWMSGFISSRWTRPLSSRASEHR